VADAGKLADLPVLPQLEVLDLTEADVDFHDLRCLANFPRLKSLGIAHTLTSGASLRKLASLRSLERLGIDRETALSGFESLMLLEHLRDVRISPYPDVVHRAKLALDVGDWLWVAPEEVGGLRRELAALRLSHPGIVISSQYDDFFGDNGSLYPPWDNDHMPDRGLEHCGMLRLIRGLPP
jgi:hypothetical protein